jgi:hypothetical protein
VLDRLGLVVDGLPEVRLVEVGLPSEVMGLKKQQGIK